MPFMVVVFSLPLIFKRQPDFCTRYMAQVTFEVLPETFFVCDQSTRSVYAPDKMEPLMEPLEAISITYPHNGCVPVFTGEECQVSHPQGVNKVTVQDV